MDTSHDSVIRPDRLLLATDGSEDAMLAAKVATDLSLRTGARLHVAHAWYHQVQALGYPTLAWTDYSDLYEREARRILETQVDALEAADRPLPSPSPSRPPHRRPPGPLRGIPARPCDRGQPRPWAGQPPLGR